MAESALKEQTEQVSSLQGQLKELQSRLESAQADAESQNGTLADLEEAKDGAEEKLKAQAALVSGLKAEVEKLSSDLEEVKAKVRVLITASTTELIKNRNAVDRCSG